MYFTKPRWSRFAILCIAGSVCMPAQAQLSGRSLSGPGFDDDQNTYEAYYDSVLNVTWLGNVRLFQSQAQADPNLTASIIAASGGVIFDTPNPYDKPVPNSGSYQLSATDFDGAAGTMTWWGARAWINYLNAEQYGGDTQWRLPDVRPVNGVEFIHVIANDGSSDLGYNIRSANSEFGYLFHEILGNRGFYDTSGNPQSGYGLGNVGPFAGLIAGFYWYHSEYPTNLTHAWTFNTQIGTQNGFTFKGDKFLAWAVRPGDIAAVPIPPSVGLFLGGLIVASACSRRKPS